jgi:hypothetical protein
MTVAESLSLWLKDLFADPANGFSGEFVIGLEALPDWEGFQNTALYSNPNDGAVTLTGGQIRHTEFKTLYARRPFKEKEQRAGNEAFFELLKRRITATTLAARFPEDGRKWRRIEYTGGAYPSGRADNNDTAVYQITLKIVYEDMG